LETLVNLRALDLPYNKITEIKGLETLVNLLKLYLGANLITEIPPSIILLNGLTTIHYNDNPIEYIPPPIQRFINRVNRRNFNTNTIYNDGQNIHDSTIQKCIRDSIEKIISVKPLSKEIVINHVMEDEILTDKIKRLIFEYCDDDSIHSVLQITFEELFLCYWTIITAHKDASEIKKIMNTELADAECKCFTGRLTRLVNCLNGFDDRVSIQISDKSQISNIVLMVKQSLEDEGEYTVDLHKEKTKKELEERGYEQEIIDEFIEYIE